MSGILSSPNLQSIPNIGLTMKWPQICPVTHSLLKPGGRHFFLVKQQQRRIVSRNTFDTQQQPHLWQAIPVPSARARPHDPCSSSWHVHDSNSPIAEKLSFRVPLPFCHSHWENQNLGQPNSLPSWPLPPRSKHRRIKSIQVHGLQPQLTLSCSLSLTPASRKTALKSHLLAPLYLITPPSFFNPLDLASTSTPCQFSPKFITTCILCNPKDTSPFLFSFNFLLCNPWLHSSWLATFSRLSCSHIFPVVLLLLQPLRWNVLWKLFSCSILTC